MSTDIFTPEAVKAVTSVEQADALKRGAISAWKSADRAKGKAVLRASLATRALMAVGVLFPEVRGAEGSITTLAYAKQYGLTSAGNVTLWRLLGIAVVDRGVDPESVLFQHLAHKGGATREVVSAVIEKDGSTVEDIETALRTVIAPDGKRIAGNGNTGTARPSEGEGSEVSEAAAGLSPFQRCEAALAVLADEMPSLTAEDFATVENRLDALRTKEVTVRTHAAKKTAKKTAKRAA